MSIDDFISYIFLFINALVLVFAVVSLRRKNFIPAYLATVGASVFPIISIYVVAGLEKIFCPTDTCDIYGHCTCAVADFASGFGWTMLHGFFLFFGMSLLLLLIVLITHGYVLYKSRNFKYFSYVAIVTTLVVLLLIFSIYQIVTFSL